IQYVREHGEVCPANWQPGEDTMVPDPEKAMAYFQAHA
ncbi:MAG: peroxiredoxin, partial [bacterium]